MNTASMNGKPMRDRWADVPGDAGGGDSFCSPIESERERNESRWRPVPISALGPSAPPAWVWPGYIAKGHKTLLSAIPKGGKTTLVSRLLHDLEHGGGLVTNPCGVRTLLVTEESAGLWAKRRDALNLGDAVDVIALPFLSRPSPREWERFIEYIAAEVKAKGYGLVVLDTIAALWPCVEENDAGKVLNALLPLNAIVAAGAALLLIHHVRKSDGGEGQASRGSGALTGFVDTIVELRRYDAENAHDRRRVLKAWGRFDETIPESVLELGEDGYRVIGDKADVGRSDRMDTIRGILRDACAGLTVDEVRDRWPTEPKPGKGTVRADLNAGTGERRWQRVGTGARNDPHRFGLDGFVSSKQGVTGERNESGSERVTAYPGGPEWTRENSCHTATHVIDSVDGTTDERDCGGGAGER